MLARLELVASNASNRLRTAAFCRGPVGGTPWETRLKGLLPYVADGAPIVAFGSEGCRHAMLFRPHARFKDLKAVLDVAELPENPAEMARVIEDALPSPLARRATALGKQLTRHPRFRAFRPGR